MCACAEPKFQLDRALVLILRWFSPKEDLQPVLLFLAWCLGKTPSLGKGEDLGTCAPTCSDALPALSAHTRVHMCMYFQSCSASPRHSCVVTCRRTSTYTWLHSIRPNGVNTCIYMDCKRQPASPRHRGSVTLPALRASLQVPPRGT